MPASTLGFDKLRDPGKCIALIVVPDPQTVGHRPSLGADVGGFGEHDAGATDSARDDDAIRDLAGAKLDGVKQSRIGIAL